MPAGIRIEVDASELDRAVKDLRKSFGAAKVKEYNMIAAVAAEKEIQSYYVRRGRNIWINPRLSTHGPGRERSRWSDQVATGWSVGTVTSKSVTISNKTVGLAHKITGGTIRAKKAKFLTIPVHPEAHNKRARQFRGLFFAKGGLMRKTPDGRVEMMYKLKKSVTQKPWPGALPPDQKIADAFIDTWLEEWEDEFES